MNSQNKVIREFLLKGKRLTALDALMMFGCFRLASRIHDLKHSGMEIKDAPFVLDNGKRIKEYFI